MLEGWWNPVSSRIVSARLKLGDQVLGQAGGHRSQPMHVSVIVHTAVTHQRIKLARRRRMYFTRTCSV